VSTRHVIDLSGAGWRLWRDQEAAWEHDALYLPPVDLALLPAIPPSCGWKALDHIGTPVSVPGTVEEHFWNTDGDYRGVSWWWRPLAIPSDLGQRRVVLEFDAVRLRAEVFLDQQLVGYDVIGNTPFEVELTGRVTPGRTHQLAVRITDPCGNFSWEDFQADRWGDYTLPASHGFGGITQPVRLLLVDPVSVEDIFVRNRPELTAVDVLVTLRNTTGRPTRQDVRVQVFAAGRPREPVFEQVLPDVEIPPGAHELTVPVNVPRARPWSPTEPNLYVSRVALAGGDALDTRFGFRWFTVEDSGGQTVFRLNGRRIVLRSSISWGFWPGNGIYPTPALAEREIRIARAYGLNMLNFHRGIGLPRLLDLADELGLLYYEEPGGYTAHGGDDFCFAWAREKLLRMIIRDRNHPSLVIYNMINEEDRSDPQLRHKQDMRAAHRLDPTRIITFTSGWSKEGDDPKKLHMLPDSDRQLAIGWYDFHHATGPGVYRDEFYQGPHDYRLRTENAAEIVFWGEEGAIGTPPRLERIACELEGEPDGWDGADYRRWYRAYVDYLDRKQLREFFPTVDALTSTLGDIALYYQGRMIENIRLGNLTDAYVVNGWESEKLENHSGVVDCFRNPKGDPRIMAHYNQPVFVAVKLRTKVAHAPARVVADFHLINEGGLSGRHTLTAWLEDAAGGQHWLQDWPVDVTGGETYGELLVERAVIDADVPPGPYTVRATLRDARTNAVCATGEDELLLVRWRGTRVPAGGALLEQDDTLGRFVNGTLGGTLPALSRALPPLRYVLAGDCNATPWQPIPPEVFLTADGRDTGLTGEYFRGATLNEPLLTRVDRALHVAAKDDPRPGVFVPDTRDTKDFSVRWTGRLTPPESGFYVFRADADDGVRLWIDDELVLDAWSDYAWWHESRPRLVHGRPIALKAGHAYDVRIEYYQVGGQGQLTLLWTTPGLQGEANAVVQEVVRRVHDDGTTAVITHHADTWAQALAALGVLTCHGVLHGKRHWLGSNFFVRRHALFDGLPTNIGMNWPYQEFAEYGARRYGLLLEHEEAIVGIVSDHQHQVGTAVGVVRHGRGRFVLSTLELLPRLHLERGPCEVVRKVLCNYLAYAAAHAPPGA
jgi:beta-galactosidase